MHNWHGSIQIMHFGSKVAALRGIVQIVVRLSEEIIHAIEVVHVAGSRPRLSGAVASVPTAEPVDVAAPAAQHRAGCSSGGVTPIARWGQPVRGAGVSVQAAGSSAYRASVSQYVSVRRRPLLPVVVPLGVQSEVLLDSAVVPQRVPEQSPGAGEADELLLEAPVAQRHASLALDPLDGVEEFHLPVDHHVGDARGCATVDAHGAVYEHGAAVPLGAVQITEGLVEVTRDVVTLVVVGLELIVLDPVSGVRGQLREGSRAFVSGAVEDVSDTETPQ